MNMGLACVWVVSVVIGQVANAEPVPATAIIHPLPDVIPDDVSWLLGSTNQVNGHRELGARLKQRHEWGSDNLPIRDAYQPVEKPRSSACQTEISREFAQAGGMCYGIFNRLLSRTDKRRELRQTINEAETHRKPKTRRLSVSA